MITEEELNTLKNKKGEGEKEKGYLQRERDDAK